MAYNRTPKPQFAHIASLIRSKMEEYNWSVTDLNRIMGLPGHKSNVYHWIKGTGAPNAESRARLAKALSVDESELIGKANVQLPIAPRTAIIHYKNKPRTIHEPSRVLAPRVDPLNFTVLTDGTARIQLDITMPLDNAKALLRMILDADVIYKK